MESNREIINNISTEVEEIDEDDDKLVKLSKQIFGELLQVKEVLHQIFGLYPHLKPKGTVTDSLKLLYEHLKCSNITFIEETKEHFESFSNQK